MKRSIFLVLLLLVACGSATDYEVVEEKQPGENRYTIRVVTDATDEEAIKSIIDELTSDADAYWGIDSLTAHIHEPADNDDFGAKIATAKFAGTNKGVAQTGVDEMDTIYVEME